MSYRDLFIKKKIKWNIEIFYLHIMERIYLIAVIY
ncbi:hypothetical protein LCGC14_1018710, partial [marine sediment metagenome]